MGAIPESDPDEPQVTKPFKFVTDSIANVVIAGYDARFPQQNQTKHCWQNYVDYYKCVEAKGEEFRPCTQFYHSYRALCPKAWTDRWDGQREGGNFPVQLDR